MKILNASLIALALISTGATAALAGGDPPTVYSNGSLRNSAHEPGWMREGKERSNYRIDRESRDTLRLDDAGINAGSH